MKTVVERLRALKLASAHIRCMPFLPLKSIIHLLEPELRPGQGQAGEAFKKGVPALHRAGRPGKSKCQTVERQEWAALQADLIALLQARAHHHVQQQRQQTEPEHEHAQDAQEPAVKAETAVSSPAPPPPQGRGGKGAVRHRRHHHHARHGAEGKGAHGKAAQAATAAETKETEATSLAAAQKQRQTHEQLILLAVMPEARVSEFVKGGGGLLAVRQVVEASKFGLQVGAPMRYRVLRNQLAAVQDKYLFMRKRFCDATDVFLANQQLRRECRQHVQLYRSGTWLEQGPSSVSPHLASADGGKGRTLVDTPTAAGHESKEALFRAPLPPPSAQPPGSSMKGGPSSKRAVRPQTGVTEGAVGSPACRLAQPVPQRVAEGLQGSLGTGIAFADDMPASPWTLGLGRRNQHHLPRAGDVSSDSDESQCSSQDSDVIKDPAALMLAKPPARARFPLDLGDAQHVFGWLQEASGVEMDLQEASRGLPGPYFQQIVSGNETEQQERSRRLMDALAEELLPVQHGALGALDSSGSCRGTARVSVDMPLHLIPPFVPVDLPSRKKVEQAVDHLQDVLLSALCRGDREQGSSAP